MKCIEELKNEYARENGFHGWSAMMLQKGTITNEQVSEVAERYAQSQTQELKEQNSELVELVERCKDVIYAYNDYKPTATGNEILQAIQDRLTKYNHLK